MIINKNSNYNKNFDSTNKKKGIKIIRKTLMSNTKLNICYISNSAAPSNNASSLQISKLCETLSKLGNTVTLVLPNTGELKKNYKKFYNIKYDFKIKKD